MKLYNKIVESVVEPNIEDLWIKDNAIYVYGSKGWSPLLGSNGKSNNHVIIGDIFKLTSSSSSKDIEEALNPITYNDLVQAIIDNSIILTDIFNSNGISPIIAATLLGSNSVQLVGLNPYNSVMTIIAITNNNGTLSCTIHSLDNFSSLILYESRDLKNGNGTITEDVLNDIQDCINNQIPIYFYSEEDKGLGPVSIVNGDNIDIIVSSVAQSNGSIAVSTEVYHIIKSTRVISKKTDRVDLTSDGDGNKFLADNGEYSDTELKLNISTLTGTLTDDVYNSIISFVSASRPIVLCDNGHIVSVTDYTYLPDMDNIVELYGLTPANINGTVGFTLDTYIIKKDKSVTYNSVEYKLPICTTWEDSNINKDTYLVSAKLLKSLYGTVSTLSSKVTELENRVTALEPQ